ncbi:transposase [Ahniella affigens]|uniref:Transposase n=1 Tax=Ahniella affigens TaxID=2021234 RepID=A0A2P1PNC1_9GAMM|nr:transposase [Ahniella affigens]
MGDCSISPERLSALDRNSECQRAVASENSLVEIRKSPVAFHINLMAPLNSRRHTVPMSRISTSQSSRLRRGRINAPDCAYVITFCTDNRAAVFANPNCASLMHDLFRNMAIAEPESLYAWVLMPDHVHCVMVIRPGQTLARLVGSLKGRTAQQFHAATGKRGSLWQNGFHDHAIRRHEHMDPILTYMAENPLRAGLVEHIADWPWIGGTWMEQ